MTLPEPQVEKAPITYDVPHILCDATVRDGFPMTMIREGGRREVEATIRTEWSEQPVDERERQFVIRARNTINLCGLRVSVLNDLAEMGVMLLPPSNPTATDYLKLVGAPVMIHFSCERDRDLEREHGIPIYKITRQTIPLP